MTGRIGWASVVVGVVGMWVTGCLMELWETLFAGRGKAAQCFTARIRSTLHTHLLDLYIFVHNSTSPYFLSCCLSSLHLV